MQTRIAICLKARRTAKASIADYVLLDSGTGTGVSFDWSLISDIGREFFLAGGINSSQRALKSALTD
ncbi:MAG: hypothetical protein UH824_06920 [Acutalibacteraceae bacterium]|nr:hypothetical protein [Acutalibacteraceae bacterium]